MISELEALVARIAPLLAKHPPAVQGAALADLTATWLAGHMVMGDAVETAELRERLLQTHVQGVRSLIPVNEAAILKRQSEG